MSDSTVYTIGTILRRAQTNDLTATVYLRGGDQFIGQVQDIDGHGLVLQTGNHTLHVLRLESIDAVSVALGASEQPTATPPPALECHQCGPGYRIGQEGCHH